MTISRSGSLTTIVGYKLSSTATSGGTTNNAPYLADTSLTGSVEENVTHSGTCNGDCQAIFDGAARPSLEDTTQGFAGSTSVGFLLENSTTSAFCLSQGRDLPGDNLSSSNIFANGNSYRVHGFAKASPANWQQHYQWNLLWITGGTGVGQVNLIQNVTDVGSEVRFWMQNAWETEPDSTSTYKILYSPLDVVWNNALAGTIYFDSEGSIPMWVEIDDELEWGNVSGTETGFGWADLFISLNNSGASSTLWEPTNEFYNNCKFFLGTFNPIAESTGRPGNLRSIKRIATSGGFLSGKSGVSLIDKRVYGSANFGDFGLMSSIEESYHSFVFGGGALRSFDNGPLAFCPQSTNSEADFILWIGGNWGEPFAGFGAKTKNCNVIGAQGKPTTSTPSGGRGLGWLGGNSGDDGYYFTRITNANLQTVGVYKDGAGRDIDYWQFDWYGGGFNYHIFVLKTLDFVVQDETDQSPISGATVEIYDRLGNLISYVDSGATIIESLDDSETLIDVSNDAYFAAGQTILIDNEYMYVNSVTPGTPDRLSVTREYRLPLYFDASPHEYTLAGYDPTIYIIQSITTGADGIVPTQTLFRSNVNWVGGPGSGFASQVTVNGTNYTCILNHQAAAGNKPPNVTYWSASGTNGIPWEVGKHYSNGASGNKSLSDFIPWRVYCRKYGYHSFDVEFAPNFDSPGVAQPILLEPDTALSGVTEAQAAALPITYNSGTNEITVDKDGTWFYDDDTACTMLHIYAKSQYEDWGLIHKHINAEQYTVDCKIIIGNGTDAAYFKAEGIHLMFSDGIAQADNTVLFDVKNNSVARFGAILDDVNKWTNAGCSVHIEESVYTVQFRASNGGTINMYSTKFHQPSGLLRYANNAWNCHFSGGMSVDVQAPSVDFDHLIIEGTGTGGPRGFTINGGLGSFSNIHLRNVEYGLDLCQCFTNEAVMRNVHAEVTDGGYIGGPDDGYFVDIVDSGFSDWTNPNDSAFAYAGTIRRIYTVRINVLDQEETPISGAKVTMKDKNGSTVFSLTTDGYGDITPTEVVEGTLTYVADTPGDIVTLSPFTLIIEKAGFDTYRETFIMPINRIDGFDWVFNLMRQRVYIDQEGGLRS